MANNNNPARKPANAKGNGATVTANNPASANVTALPYGTAHGPAHKYGAQAANVPCAGNTYSVTALGRSVASAGGKGKSGKVTVMGLVALAAVTAAKGKGTVSGLAIVQAMQTNPAIIAAWLNGQTKAGKYAPANGGNGAGKLPCPHWCSGYVVGAARSAAGLLAKVAG